MVRIPRQYHSGLIGSSGKYVIRLEEKYGVKITFAREPTEDAQDTNGTGPRARENLKADEVLIKGGKKGVASAKTELLEVSISVSRSQIFVLKSSPFTLSNSGR